jgi:hypothetical protein
MFESNSKWTNAILLLGTTSMLAGLMLRIAAAKGWI